MPRMTPPYYTTRLTKAPIGWYWAVTIHWTLSTGVATTCLGDGHSLLKAFAQKHATRVIARHRSYRASDRYSIFDEEHAQ